MKQWTKLLLDIAFGAVIPILILNFLTPRLGAPPAYVISALVPVAWVAVDLLFITRKFNFITSYIGLSAIITGALAFWFVDGLLYAIKDNASLIVTTLVFVGTLLFGIPVFKFFFAQAVNPDTPERTIALEQLLREPGVTRALRQTTWLVIIANLIVIAINFYLNLYFVVSPFGTPEFNSQVAYVNAITRVVLPIPNFIVFGVGFWLVYREVYRLLPQEGDKPQLESDFWTLMEMREHQQKGEASTEVAV